jgi:1,4-alpha-glucan branching enzyme
VRVERADGSVRDHALCRDELGYHEAVIPGVHPGDRYRCLFLGGRLLPDPASRHQPEGVHGPSEVVDPAFDWTDRAWLNPPLRLHLIYAVHVGTFRPPGRFEGAIGRLDDPAEPGVAAVQLMPVDPPRHAGGMDVGAVTARAMTCWGQGSSAAADDPA